MCELQTSHDLYSDLLASTDIAILLVDRTMSIKSFNPAAAELLNLCNTDIGRCITDIRGRIDNEHFSYDAQQVLEQQITIERVILAFSDSQSHSYLRRMIPYKPVADEVNAVVVTFVDISDRHQLEKDLLERLMGRNGQLSSIKEQLALVLNSTNAAVWGMDANQKRQLVFRESHRALFGELPTAPDDSWDWWLERVRPDERQQLVDSLQQALSGDASIWEQRYCFRVADGSYHWIADTAHIIRSTSGKLLRVTGTMVDIDQYIKIETQLSDREQRLAVIMKHVAEALLVTNQQGFITDFNSATEKMFAYADNELTGQHVSQLLPADVLPEYQQRMTEHLSNGTLRTISQRQELLGLRKDGSTFPLEVTVAVVEQLGVYVGVIRDLSEQRRLEHEIINVSTWEQEKTGRELHDGLGQRLTGLNMLATHIKKRLDQGGFEEAELLDDIIVQLKEATQEVGRISHGLAPVSITPDGLEDALDRLVSQVGDKVGINCRFESRLNMPISNQIAANQIFRIAQEAFNNALKYSHATTITLTLTNSDGFIELAVRDNGSGFDMDELMNRDGFGIRIMHYRANSIGANLTIDTGPGEGTQLLCRYPYQGFPDSDSRPD